MAGIDLEERIDWEFKLILSALMTEKEARRWGSKKGQLKIRWGISQMTSELWKGQRGESFNDN